MVRTQIQLDDDQYKRLKALAAKRSQSLSLLVRESVERLLDASERAEAWDRVMEAAGRCHDPEKTRDVSTRHDDYIVETYRE
jgi:predicted transcriptional regulator